MRGFGAVRARSRGLPSSNRNLLGACSVSRAVLAGARLARTVRAVQRAADRRATCRSDSSEECSGVNATLVPGPTDCTRCRDLEGTSGVWRARSRSPVCCCHALGTGVSLRRGHVARLGSLGDRRHGDRSNELRRGLEAAVVPRRPPAAILTRCVDTEHLVIAAHHRRFTRCHRTLPTHDGAWNPTHSTAHDVVETGAQQALGISPARAALRRSWR